jgi:Fur family ferric uptake transcriptional regulator
LTAGAGADRLPAMRARQTRQLKSIESVLRHARRPLAIAEIHAAASGEFLGLGIATVYRTVRALIEAGKIVTVSYAGQPTRYEWAVATNHSHFICHECKRVFDIEAPERVPLPKKRPKGFRFVGDEVIYYGVCADCGAGGGAKRGSS